jgi:hypothetical protein
MTSIIVTALMEGKPRMVIGIVAVVVVVGTWGKLGYRQQMADGEWQMTDG